MHDPLVVAFVIRRPWPYKTKSPYPGRWRIGYSHWNLAGRGFYFPSAVTVWHREPGGHDSGEVCKQHSRVQDAEGNWQWKFHHGWRFHITHWKIQVHALQRLRRRLLTRCIWCGGPSRKGDQVDVSHSWDGPRARWWQGERGLYHRDCSSISRAHASCTCEDPITDQEGYGTCARCARYRGWGTAPEVIARRRELQAIPVGKRATPREAS